MTLVIDLSPEVEDRLKEEAARRGVDEAQYVRRLIETHLPDAEGIRLAKLMQTWMQEDATDDPAELERREAELKELKVNLNASRAATGERLLFP